MNAYIFFLLFGEKLKLNLLWGLFTPEESSQTLEFASNLPPCKVITHRPFIAVVLKRRLCIRACASASYTHAH